MKKIILSSYGFEKNKSLEKEISKLLPLPTRDLSAVIITTASAEWKEKNKHAVFARQSLENMGFKKVSFLDVEFEDSSKLENFDVIYINGGNPFYLLYYLKKSRADKVIKKLANKAVVLVGISGGGMILAPNINIVNYFDKKSNIVNLKNLTGLNLTDIVIYPHYTKEYEKKIKDFEKLYRCKVVRLKDSQSITILEED